MANSQKQARHWLGLVLGQSFPSRDILAAHVGAGEITSLCTCGCHSFDFAITDGSQLEPLSKGSGLLCELAFSSNFPEEIDILLFTDARGYFAGADVTYGSGNIGAMPEGIEANALKGVWPSGRTAEA